MTSLSPIPAASGSQNPARAIDAWPAGRRLAALLSSGEGRRDRFSLVAEPSDVRVLMRTEKRTGSCLVWRCGDGSELDAGDDAFAALDSLTRTATQTDTQGPFGAGWILGLRYELGFEAEPTAQLRDRPGPTVLATAHRIDHAWVHDHTARSWHPIGDPEPLDFGGCASPAERSRVEVSSAAMYRDAVREAVRLIEAGDVFQANLAHAATARCTDPRSLFASLLDSAAPWYGALLETGDETVVSASPELFLDIEPSADGLRLTTRPMKGTRPLSASPDELAAAEKDRAELAMIVDLMRNDLGRVARFGSVRVAEPRTIERHGSEHAGVYQAVATVEATAPAETTLGTVLRATFPPGSVTGAPKVRAMQIIEQLETFDRGAYCGSIGFMRDDGRAVFNVAIRTATVRDGAAVYPIGAGIVADSVPGAELQETMDKAAVLRAALGED